MAITTFIVPGCSFFIFEDSRKTLGKYSSYSSSGQTCLQVFIPLSRQRIAAAEISMAASQFLPIPETIHTLACETVSRRAGRLPFTRDSIEITEKLIDVTMESLNADVTRILPLKTYGRGSRRGLVDILNERTGCDQSAAVPVIADILINAGLAEPAEVLDTATHTKTRGIRLLSAWTWHIGSGDFLTTKGLNSGEETDTWLARCPICKTGILNRVIGKRLFGIPPTDYYIDCSHCGAKFIPEKSRFRLVSIARIADPKWRQYLNSSRTSDEWSALINKCNAGQQAPQRIATSQYRMALKKPEVSLPSPVPRREKPLQQVEGVPVHFPTLKDGTLVVTGTTKTLYFRTAKLRYLRGIRHDTFTHAERTLKQALESPVFSDVKPIFENEYARYLPLRLGPVTEELKKKNDPRWRLLLHRFGDADFGSFALDNEEQAQQKGILIIFVQDKLCFIAACHTNFADLVDRSFGNITADQCYRDGDETRCRINNLITNFHDTQSIWFHEMDDDCAIDTAAADLRKRYMKVPEDTS
jgi:hypothetical protein